MADSILRTSNQIGYCIDAMGSSSSRALNSTAIWQAFSFIAQGKTLDTVSVYFQKTGSPVGGDITLELQADSGGIPSNTAIETRSPSSIAAGSARCNVSGFTTALTEGNQYWIVIKNLNAVTGNAASHYITVPFLTYFTLPQIYGFNIVGTVNSGTAWTSQQYSRASSLLLKYSDNTYDGFPARGALRADAFGVTAYRVYGTRAVGVKFSGLIAGITYNVKSVVAIFVKVLSPSAGLRCRIYSGSTLLGTSRTIPTAQNSTLTGGIQVSFDFATPVGLVSTSSPHRVVFDVVGAGGDASNYYTAGHVQALDTSSEVLALAPMSGTWAHTYTTDNTAGTITWVDTTDIWPSYGMMLAFDTPFTVGAGSGRVFDGMSGGFVGG